MKNLKVIAVASVFGAAMAVSSAAYADDCSYDNLDGCIGCGCLSLKTCKLYNPDDIAAEGGPGPRVLR
jgi:hypothetical protein